jgi:hypothetical protein
MSERIERMRQAKRQLAGSGEALPAGAIGEVIVGNVGQTVGTSSTGTTLSTITLFPGVYRIDAYAAIINSAGAITSVEWAGRITTNNALNPGTNEYYTDFENGAFGNNVQFPSTNQPKGSGSNYIYVTVNTTTLYYLRGSFTAAGGGSIGLRGMIRAVRLA